MATVTGELAIQSYYASLYLPSKTAEDIFDKPFEE